MGGWPPGWRGASLDGSKRAPPDGGAGKAIRHIEIGKSPYNPLKYWHFLTSYPEL